MTIRNFDSGFVVTLKARTSDNLFEIALYNLLISIFIDPNTVSLTLLLEFRLSSIEGGHYK
jgi:hypothetical protein